LSEVTKERNGARAFRYVPRHADSGALVHVVDHLRRGEHFVAHRDVRALATAQ
jgi:hypothetical protein